MTDLRELLDEYELRRSRRSQQLDRQREEFYRDNPDIQALLQKRDEQLLAAMKRMIEDMPQREEIIRQAKEEADAIDEEIEARLRQRGLRFPEMEYDCPICRDMGYVDGRTGRKICQCLEKSIFTELYHGRGWKELRHTFADFDESIYGEGNEAQRKLCRKVKSYLQDYAAAFPENERRTVVLMGQPGLGKTFFLECLAAEIGKRTERLLFISAFDLFAVFHRFRLGEIETVEPILQAEALFIDDLGAEQLTQNVTKEYMFKLLDERQAAGRHTFFATNLSEKSLKERYTEKVASRLLAREASLVFLLKGKDLRL